MYKAIGANNLALACGGSWGRVDLVRDMEEEKKPERVKRLKTHIKNDNYFGVLSAMLNILVAVKGGKWKKILQNISGDLEFLQENYRIVKKD